MEWLFELNTWVGLLTLIVLEIVLGIDNLIFIAILANKLPPAQRDRARVMGLGFALLMRLAMLTGISWIFTLNQPWINIGTISFSGRELILIFGGFFLVMKGTMELHERMEGGIRLQSSIRSHPSFWIIVTQIIVLDAVFSLDSVITAVGMVDRLEIMIAAVTVAMAVMLMASRPLTHFVTARPTIVILCLGFLLMIGFALIAEGFGFEVPKGYLYAAIAFSISIESLNQIARRNLLKFEARRPLRERTAEGILRLLGKSHGNGTEDENILSTPESDDTEVAFGVEERNMMSGVLRFAERSIHSIMTPRTDISWINLSSDPASIIKLINESPHGFFPVCKGELDNIVGIGRAKDLIADLLQYGHISESSLRAPLLVHETIRTLDLMETLKAAHGQLVLVLDEFGTIEGLVTPMDLFEAIAGDFPDEDEAPDIIADGEGRWVVDGGTDLLHLEQSLNVYGLKNEDDEYSTLAGFLLEQFGRLPDVGNSFSFENNGANLNFKVLELDGRRIAKVLINQAEN